MDKTESVDEYSDEELAFFQKAADDDEKRSQRLMRRASTATETVINAEEARAPWPFHIILRDKDNISRATSVILVPYEDYGWARGLSVCSTMEEHFDVSKGFQTALKYAEWALENRSSGNPIIHPISRAIMEIALKDHPITFPRGPVSMMARRLKFHSAYCPALSPFEIKRIATCIGLGIAPGGRRIRIC